MSKKKLLILASLISLLAWLDPFQEEVEKGNDKFQNKKFSESKNHYDKAEKYAPNNKEKSKLAFNKGTADYMAEDYDSAIANFKKSLQSEDKDIQKKAFLNMGNAYVKKGDTKEAINSYINALKIDPNYDKVKKNIEYLLAKKQQQEQQNQDQQDQDKDKKKNKNKQSQASQAKQNEKKKNKDKQSKDKQKVAKKMNKEQIKKILEAMKKKSVQRKKEGQGGVNSLEKNW